MLNGSWATRSVWTPGNGTEGFQQGVEMWITAYSCPMYNRINDPATVLCNYLGMALTTRTIQDLEGHGAQ